MCLEDLRMGRNKYTAVHFVTCPASTNTILCAKSNKRVHLSFGVSQNSIAAAPSSAPMTTDDGFVVSSGTKPLDIDIEVHGQVAQESWLGRGIGGSCVVIVLETFYEDNGPVT